MKIKKQNNLIIIEGHADSIIKCAKITQLCLVNNPIEIKEGYAVLPYNETLYNNLLAVNDNLLFVPAKYHATYYDGTNFVTIDICSQSHLVDSDIVTPL